MRNIVIYISDIAVMVGCCLGVGFISGKEAQVYFGSVSNVILFALLYAIVNILLRQYCKIMRCNSVEKLSRGLFGKGASVFDTLISVCCFVCIVTMLAGAEACMDKILHLSKLPVYAFICAVISAIALTKGDTALKIANAISITLAILLVVIMLRKNRTTLQTIYVSPFKPIIYALFSATMSFGVTTRLGFESETKRNIICPIISATVLALFMTAIIRISDFNLELPTIDAINDVPTRILAVITLILAAVTGIVACAYPIAEQVYPIIPDNSLLCSVIFGLALAFSMFGFDFAVKVGYVLVGAAGFITVAAASFQLFGNFANKRLYKARSSSEK